LSAACYAVTDSLLNRLGAVWYVVLVVEEVAYQLEKRL